MKKKTLLTLIAITMLSLAACGKTEEASGSNVNEPVQESPITESQPEPTETPAQESQEVTEPTEAPVEETNALPYSIEFVYCNEDSKNLEYVTSITDSYLLQAIAPYVIVTNTSDSTYSIEIEDTVASDTYFEPGEQLRAIAMFSDFDEDDNLDLVDMTTAYTLADGEENIIYAWSVDIDIDEEPEEDFFTRGMFTITQADVTSTEESNEFTYINYNVPAELEGIEGHEIFVVFHDEAGTEIGACEGNYRTGTLEYHEVVANWASAEIYYRYE